MARARAVPHPVLSSPRRLAFLGFGVTLVVYAIQLESGIPAWLSWSPVELSSNVVALMGLAWTALQLRASWADRDLRRAWLAGSAGMALLAVEGNVGELFLMETHGPDEMSLSIGLWLIAAWLIFRVGRRYAMRRSVVAVLRLAFAIQIAAQLIGWWAAYGAFSDEATELLDYVNDTGELVAVLAYLAALLLAVFSADKSYQFPLSAIGRKGREIHRDFGLGRSAVGLPVLREVAATLSIVAFWRRAATRVHRDGGPTPLRQLAGLVRCAAFSRVDPNSYYLFELFRAQRLGAAADAVMTNAETAGGLTASIQSARAAAGPRVPLDDRLAFAEACARYGLPVSPILATAEAGAFQFSSGGPESLDQNLVVRFRSTREGGVMTKLRRVDQLLYRDDAGDLVNIEMAVSRIAALSRTSTLVVNSRPVNHEAVARFAWASTLVFRVITCLDHRGEPQATHGVMRILRADEPEWPLAPGAEWSSAIDLQSGLFGPVATDAAETCTEWRYAHPITQEMVSGVKCAGWADLSAAAIEAHRAFDDHVVVGWDLAWTPDGPLILDADANPDFTIIQRCYGAPIGQSALGPLLDAHLDRVVALRS